MMRFVVNCKAVPQGSVKSFIVNTKGGRQRAVITHSKSQTLYEVRQAIITEYLNAGGVNYRDKAVRIHVLFSFTRPKSVSAKKRPYMTVKSDLDKLTRMLLDSLTTIAYDDDSQVVELNAKKVYGEHDFIEVTIDEYTD